MSTVSTGVTYSDISAAVVAAGERVGLFAGDKTAEDDLRAALAGRFTNCIWTGYGTAAGEWEVLPVDDVLSGVAPDEV